MHFRTLEYVENDRRQNTNDGCDLYGRRIEVGDLVAKPEAGYNKSANMRVARIAKVGGGNKGVTAYFERIWNDTQYAPEPIRYSGRCIILQRADGRVPFGEE